MTRTWRDYNYFLLGCVLVLSGFSMALVYSATLNNPDTQGYFLRHLANLLIGAVAMVGLTIMDYHALQAWAVPLYLAAIAALGVVLAIGSVLSGAQSWLDFGVRTFQPSELCKLLIVISLAAFWARFETNTGSVKAQLGGLILAGIPLGMVFIQPDFGTAMVIATIWVAMAWTAGLRWWQIVLLLIAAVPVAIYGWNNVLDEEQKSRILVFIDPIKYDPDLNDGAWNILQALTAIQSGGLMGHGWTQGPLTQNSYIPAQYTDFIFAASGEELGFVGGTMLVLFECILMWQAISVARTARDTFGRLIAVGLTAMIFCHVLVNVGMNMSIMPITGIPLPFISYGGSFTLTTFAAIGLLQSVALRRRKLVFG